MAAVSKSGTPTLSTIEPTNANRVGSGLFAGEDIGACDACYIKASDGKVWRSTGAAANAAAKVRGFAGAAAKAGQPVQLYTDVDFAYGSGLSPGTELFLSGTTAGGLVDAASTGGTGGVGFVIDATRIRVYSSRY